jgi:membrane fusion protein (multidrug efflux system)
MNSRPSFHGRSIAEDRCVLEKPLPPSKSQTLAGGVFKRFGALAAGIGFGVVALTGCKEKAGPVFQPPVVEIATVIQQDVPVVHEWVATLDGDVNAQIRAQVTGYLSAREYQEGSFVRRGDPLFEIDPRPLQAVLNQAKGQLAQAEAQLDKTALDVKRYTPLAKTSAISQEELDDAVQANLAAQAAVASAKAAVEKAELDVGFTHITSPIDGIAGMALAQIGDLAGPGGTGNLTTVSSVNPIRAYIALSEQEYLEVATRQSLLQQRDLELILADGSVFPQRGRILFTDREVNDRTGTIKVASLFDNPGNLLRPGQFGRVRAQLKVKKRALLIPKVAVNELQDGYQVAVVDADNRVDLRPVKAGERIDSLWVIDEGLKPGERVVVEGLQKVRQGMLVTPQSAATGRP